MWGVREWLLKLNQIRANAFVANKVTAVIIVQNCDESELSDL